MHPGQDPPGRPQTPLPLKARLPWTLKGECIISLNFLYFFSVLSYSQRGCDPTIDFTKYSISFFLSDCSVRRTTGARFAMKSELYVGFPGMLQSTSSGTYK